MRGWGWRLRTHDELRTGACAVLSGHTGPRVGRRFDPRVPGACFDDAPAALFALAASLLMCESLHFVTQPSKNFPLVMCWRNRDYNSVQLSDLINLRRFDPAGGGVGVIMSPVNVPRISVKSFLL